MRVMQNERDDCNSCPIMILVHDLCFFVNADSKQVHSCIADELDFKIFSLNFSFIYDMS